MPPSLTLTRRSPLSWVWIAVGLGALVHVAITWPVLATVYGVGVGAAMMVAVLQAAGLVFGVVRPWLGIALVHVGATLGVVVTASSTGLPWPWAVTSILVVLAVQVVVGLRHGWPPLLVGWGAGLLVTVFGVLWSGIGNAGTTTTGTWANAIVFTSVSTGATAVVGLLTLWRRSREELVAERRATATELVRRQNLEERNRIAQELHDVVAHSMSVISVQATTAPYRLPGLDEASREEFASIAGSARQALTEMRGLLSLLRGGAEADLAPQPVVTDVPALVDSIRDTGAEVTLDFPSPGTSAAAGLNGVPATTGLVAYRAVQEGLSNALRHAPGALVDVVVAVTATDLRIDVVNGDPGYRGPGSKGPVSPATDARTGTIAEDQDSDDRRPPVSSASSPVGSEASGSGFGLRGMRERVEALGGTMVSGATEEAGFAVSVRLPLG